MLRIAFRMLTYDTAKYLGLILGIVFATVLIAQQAGMGCSAVLMSIKTPRDMTEVDVWVMKPQVETYDLSDPMAEIVLGRVRAIEGVAWAVPYYSGGGVLRSPQGAFRTVSIQGVDENSLVGAPHASRMLVGQVAHLSQPGAVLVDLGGYRKLYPGQPVATGREFEIGQRRAVIAGVYTSKGSFSGNPEIICRRGDAVAFARETINSMTYVLVRAKPGIACEKLAAEIRRQTGLKALSRTDFNEMNLWWMVANSGIVENFGITVTIGLIVGIVIVGQTFYMFSVENLKQFAAIKAIGVSNIVILKMLLSQALHVAVIGFAIGIGICAALFYAMNLTPGSSLCGMFLPDSVAVCTGVVVVLMVLASSLVSAWKVLTVDPAIVFRG
jgi:putative ABC transport system permease protein